MIKKSSNPDGDINKFICDSCHVQIGWCWEFFFEKGQELVYSPILCEKCGTERSKDHGAKTKKVEELEKKLKELSK